MVCTIRPIPAVPDGALIPYFDTVNQMKKNVTPTLRILWFRSWRLSSILSAVALCGAGSVSSSIASAANMQPEAPVALERQSQANGAKSSEASISVSDPTAKPLREEERAAFRSLLKGMRLDMPKLMRDSANEEVKKIFSKAAERRKKEVGEGVPSQTEQTESREAEGLARAIRLVDELFESPEVRERIERFFVNGVFAAMTLNDVNTLAKFYATPVGQKLVQGSAKDLSKADEAELVAFAEAGGLVKLDALKSAFRSINKALYTELMPSLAPKIMELANSSKERLNDNK
jgi:hypothetical protein